MNDLAGRKSVALLVDPDKVNCDSTDAITDLATQCRTDYIMVGGSITFSGTDDLILSIKSKTDIPVILFPGNLLQLSSSADYIMLLSLISGRNPELLIGNHVIAAPFLHKIKEKVIPVGYILVNGGSKTSVEYMSQTEAIPSGKPEIVVATAMAGEMLGMNAIYLEAGSGAANPVPEKVVHAVRLNTAIPLIVGGGIRDYATISGIFNAGADMIVLGNGCENNSSLLTEACRIRDNFNKK